MVNLYSFLYSKNNEELLIDKAIVVNKSCEIIPLNLTGAQKRCDKGVLPSGPPLQVQDPRVGRPHHVQRRRRQR